MCRLSLPKLFTICFIVAYFPRFADHVIFILEGRIIKEGPPNQVDTFLPRLDEELQTQDKNIPENQVKPTASMTDSQKEDLTRQTGDFSIYKYYAKAVGLHIVLAYAGSQMCVTFSLNFQAVWVKLWSAAETRYPGQQTWKYMGVYLALGIVCEITLVSTLLILVMIIIPRTSRNIHGRLLNAVMKAPYNFFATTDSGATLNRFSQDMSLLDMQLPVALLQTTDGVFMCSVGAVLIFIVSKYMSIFVPFALIVLYYLQKFYLRTSRQMRYLDLEMKSPLYTNFLETKTGLSTIQAFGWQTVWTKRHLGFLDDSQRPFYLLFCIQRWLNLVLDLIVAAFAVLVVSLALLLGHRASGGALGLAMTNLLNYSTNLSYLISAWTELETSIGAIARVRTFERTTEPEEDDNLKDSIPPQGWIGRGDIRFENVTASYRCVSDKFLLYQQLQANLRSLFKCPYDLLLCACFSFVFKLHNC
jgi:ATP-binding cassette, subfamily C (CFTR/MRP), member 1